MAKIAIEIKNFDKLTKLAEKYPAVARKFIDRAIVNSIGSIQRETLPITPIKNARLIADLRVPHFAPFQGRLGSSVPYARRVHDLYSAGTPYKNPSLNKRALAGFLQVGVLRSKKTIDDVFVGALKDIVNEIAK